ncbi:hypothetical protein SAMN02745857_00951 [Andreprevotia lacus DSM 23236]|jgi:hypothetical protein|uniref:DUF2325 domain-containing protein n=1 Tax=Andreprevotia lacus DSM 23236 TaxID=1121001 RepID=A0A1W1X9A7_9NEIS|nr:DUF2325 domain-containing protein [Andreprevotia lacus]SMC20423.1 hypothetical protein SAMN02745857_00951 [Andreprevotia lacus DSM 23236]
MQAYIVGADVLGNIPDVLADYGIRIGHHVTGRNPSHQRKPAGIKGMDIVILFTDFLGHNVMRNYRQAAQAANVRFVACRRSTCALTTSLEKIAAKRCEDCPAQKRH